MPLGLQAWCLGKRHCICVDAPGNCGKWKQDVENKAPVSCPAAGWPRTFGKSLLSGLYFNYLGRERDGQSDFSDLFKLTALKTLSKYPP